MHLTHLLDPKEADNIFFVYEKSPHGTFYMEMRIREVKSYNVEVIYNFSLV